MNPAFECYQHPQLHPTVFGKSNVLLPHQQILMPIVEQIKCSLTEKVIQSIKINVIKRWLISSGLGGGGVFYVWT